MRTMEGKTRASIGSWGAALFTAAAAGACAANSGDEAANDSAQPPHTGRSARRNNRRFMGSESLRTEAMRHAGGKRQKGPPHARR